MMRIRNPALLHVFRTFKIGHHNTRMQGAQVATDPPGYDAFRTDVCMWLDLDTSIRALREGIRERQEAKLKLTRQITEFMERNNIADMSTRAGHIRFQVDSIREPLSHRVIRDRISEFYSSSPETANELSGVVFGNRQRCKRAALKRVIH